MAQLIESYEVISKETEEDSSQEQHKGPPHIDLCTSSDIVSDSGLAEPGPDCGRDVLCINGVLRQSEAPAFDSRLHNARSSKV